MSVLLMLVSQVRALSVISLQDIFMEINKQTLKSIENRKGPTIVKTTLEKKEDEGLTLSDFRIYLELQ